MEYFIISIVMLLLATLLVNFVKEECKIKVCTVISFIAFATGLYPVSYVLTKGLPLDKTINISPLFGDIYLCMDALSAFFAGIILIMGFVGLIYANGYLKAYTNKKFQLSAHCSFLMLLFAAMLSVTIVQNALIFLIAWELMSLSSFFLVIFESEKQEVLKSGIKYLVYMHFSVVFLILLFSVLTNATGSFNFADYAKILVENSQLAMIAFVLGFIGFGIKAGFVPFHNWLPDAHPAAPTHISGIMSGIMIKTGIYGILRLALLIGAPSKTIGLIVLVVSLITALYGVLYASTQNDIKRLLAYSSIENIGIIGIGIGVGLLGLAYENNIMAILGLCGATLHILNHSIFKQLLFFSVGNIYQKTHTRNIELLGGLIKKMPVTSLMLIIGSMAICGFPLLNGFVSEFLIYASMFLGIPAPNISLFITLIISIAMLAMVGTIALLTFSKLVGVSLLGVSRDKVSNDISSDVSPLMTVPLGVLAFLSFAVGLLPHFIFKIVICPVSLFTKTEISLEVLNQFLPVMQTLAILLGVFLLIVVVCILVKMLLSRHSETHNTWGCGYNKPNSVMQYSASSYVNPFVAMLKPLFKRVSNIKKPKDLFPKDAYYKQDFQDIEEAYIVNPIVKWDEKILTKFERIQNGNIQQYILFGLVFLILSIIGLIMFG